MNGAVEVRASAHADGDSSIRQAATCGAVDDVRLPAAAKKALRAYATLRRRAEQEVLLKVVQAILGSAEAAEIFLLSLDGLQGDLPSAKVLRRRVEILVERFVA